MAKKTHTHTLIFLPPKPCFIPPQRWLCIHVDQDRVIFSFCLGLNISSEVRCKSMFNVLSVSLSGVSDADADVSLTATVVSAVMIHEV